MLELLSEPESASLPDVPRDAGSLSALLIMLEVRGAIHRLPGNMYEVSRHAS